MNILGIVCSPRKEGNTEFLVKEALNVARKAGADVELLKIAEMDIAPCDGCQSCKKIGKCKIKDDMDNVYGKLQGASGIIIGTPVYFWSVSGQAKVLMDRTYALRFPEWKLKGKIAGAIAVGAHKGHQTALSTLNNFFLAHGMQVIGLGVAGYGTEKGDVKKDKRAIKEARILGEKMAAVK